MASYIARRFRKHKRALLAISSVAVITGITLAAPTGLSAARAGTLTQAASSTTQQAAGEATSSVADVTFYAVATAIDPFTLTTKSKTIYAQATYKETFGSPSGCALGVDLEEYDGYIKQWITAAHTPMKWGKCSGSVKAAYNCIYDPDVKWAYRTHIWLQAEKGGVYGNEDQAYSENNVEYWCS